MLEQGIRGNKRSKEEELQILSDITQLLPTKNDDEIMDILAIPNSTYYRYKRKVYKQAKKIWKQVCTESLEHRALLIKSTLDLAIKINKEIAEDPKQPAKDRIEATYVMTEKQVEMFTLLRDGQDWGTSIIPRSERQYRPEISEEGKHYLSS
jgi:predicted metal-dependent phosphoesterase TrpH